MAQCIWCKETGNPTSDEHIIPEALGCPPEFVLTNGEVCGPCNNGLAFLDRTLIDDFDIPAFQAGVRRKGGSPPRVDSRGNMRAYRTAEGQAIAINMDLSPITTPEGVRVGGIGKSARNIRATLTRNKNVAEINFEVSFGSSQKFARGIHKIALNATAYFLGHSAALDPQFDPVREYVRSGIGNRHFMVITCSDQEYRNTVWAPYRHKDGLNVVVRLAMVEFLVDLSPNQSALPLLEIELERTYGKNGWSLLPLT